MDMYRIRDNIREHIEEDEQSGILFNPLTVDMIEINSTGVMIYKLLKRYGKFHDIYIKMRETYSEIDENTLRKDIEEFIEILISQNMISDEYEE